MLPVGGNVPADWSPPSPDTVPVRVVTAVAAGRLREAAPAVVPVVGRTAVAAEAVVLGSVPKTKLPVDPVRKLPAGTGEN
jgi:hypothetical protein